MNNEINEKEEKKKRSWASRLFSWKTLGIFLGVAAGVFAAPIIVGMLGAVIPTAAAMILSSITSIVSFVGLAAAGLGVTALAAKGVVNLVRLMFSKNYRNTLKINRLNKKLAKLEKKREKAKTQEKQAKLDKEIEKIKNQLKELGVEDKAEELNATASHEEETKEKQTQNKQKEPQEEQTQQEEPQEEQAKAQDKNEVKNQVVGQPAEQQAKEVAPVDGNKETPVAPVPAKSKTANRANGLYDSMSEENQMIYDTIMRKKFSTLLSRMTSRQANELITLYKSKVDLLKDADPKEMTKEDAAYIAVYDKIKNTKVTQIGETPEYTDEEVTKALAAKTTVTEKDLETTKKIKERNAAKKTTGR